MPLKPTPSRVVEYGSTKAAALYFDEVIPMSIVGFLASKSDEVETIWSILGGITDVVPFDEFRRRLAIEGRTDFVVALLRDITPLEWRGKAGIDYITGWTWLGQVLFVAAATEDDFEIAFNDEGKVKGLFRLVKELHEAIGMETEFKWEGQMVGPTTSSFQVLHKVIEKLGVRNVPWIYGPVLTEENDKSPTHPMISIANLPLVDCSRLTWDQIVELRKDPDSIAKLRKLRLYAFDKYHGKPREYIENDLMQSLEQYRQIATAWGLDTVLSSMSFVLKDSAIVGTAVAAFWQVVFGRPLIEAISIGAVSSMGSLTCEVLRKSLKLRNQLDEHPMSYIISVQKLTSG